jgi:mRNA-degrading endonuclease RelE of RelBE toxin-antitoxin system
MTGANTSMTFRFYRTLRFDRSLRQLKKRYPHIAADLVAAFEAIETDSAIGVVIPKDYQIRKLRVSSSDMRRGKSGGFRLLYKLSTEEDTDDLIATLLFIYAKSEHENVPLMFLRTFFDDLEE